MTADHISYAQEKKVPASSTKVIASNWRWTAAIIKFSVVAISVIALYFQDLSMVFTGALTSEPTYQILAIPFLFGYLLYRKRRMVGANVSPNEMEGPIVQRYFSTLVGILLCSVAVLAYWYGSYTFTPLEYQMLTLPFFTAGLILTLFNTQTLRQLLFPIAFLFFLTPPPDEILYGWGSALSNFTASASNSLANLFGMHASLSSTNVGPVITLVRSNLASLSFTVDVACSGIYSVLGFIIFAIFVAYITRGQLRNKVAVLIMGIPLIIALNIIRITAILGIGYNFGEDLALTLFHEVGATVLMFIGVLTLLAVTDKIFKKPKPTLPCPTCTPPSPKPAQQFCQTCGKLFQYPKTKLNRIDATKIIGIILITVMLLSIQAPVFALTQGPAQVITQTPSGTKINASNSMLPNIYNYTLSYVYRDTQFEQESGDDAALVYSYCGQNSTYSTIWVAIQISSSITSEHRWETCLVNYPLSQGNPASVTQLDLRDIQLQANPPLTARYFAFQYEGTNQTQVVLYWYETAVFETNSTAQTKSVMISLIMYPSSAQNVSQTESQELPIAQEINNYWQPIQTWTVIALALSQNGLILATAVAVVLAAIIILEVFNSRQKKKGLRILYGRLSEQNKNIIKAVQNAQKQGNSTTEGVADQLDKLANPQTDATWLKERLHKAENAGLIKKTIINKNDEPHLNWISQL